MPDRVGDSRSFKEAMRQIIEATKGIKIKPFKETDNKSSRSSFRGELYGKRNARMRKAGNVRKQLDGDLGWQGEY